YCSQLVILTLFSIYFVFFRKEIKMAARYPIAKIVGSRIKKLRREYGLTGTEVAMALNVSQQQFSRYERGINRIDIDSLVMIADFLKVSVHYFLEDIDLEQSNSWTSEYNSLLSHGFYSNNKKNEG
ncbi:helix-turn-helix domain-containing protein, partial [Providencia hangzhouensis]